MNAAAGPRTRPQRLAALLIAGVVLAVLAFDLSTHQQLGTIGGLTDEWIVLGANVATHGVLGLESEPWLLRPPGYPFFVAVPLWLAGPPRAVTLSYIARAMGVVFAAQAVALAAAAVAAFLWLSRRSRRPQAVAAAVTLALNPLSVVLVGVLQYGILHVLGIVAGLWLLDEALATWPERRLPTAAAGVAWGLVTLVRPLTLILAPFVLVAFLVRPSRRRWKDALAATLVFVLAQAAAILPWTARNYALSGRVVPVNLQGWANIWAATLRPLPVDPDSYRWSVLGADIERVQRQVTGRERYDLATYVRFNAELEDGYRAEALANLRRDPRPFATNALRTVATLAARSSTVLLGAFRVAQPPGTVVQAAWFEPGAGFPFDAAGLRAGFRALSAVLALLAAGGLAIGLRRRETAIVATAAVAAVVVATHAIAHFEFTYSYVRLPFLVVLGFRGVAALSGRSLSLGGGRRVDAGDLLGGAVALASVGLTAALLAP